MIDKCWVIIDTADLIEWRGGARIPDKDRPRFIHTDLNSAENELLRLQEKVPHGLFVLFEAVATADQQITGTGVIEINRI